MASGVAAGLFLLMQMLACSKVWCQFSCSSETEVRLVGGGNEFSGRLEICLNGVWGTVCNDAWNSMDALVVCRQLGANSTSLLTNIHYEGAASNQSIHLDEVSCSGQEETLANCGHNGIGRHDCNHTADVGIICNAPQQECNGSNIRLQDGAGERYGRVEVCVGGVWGTVCDTKWDVVDAFVACKQLGMLTYNPVILNPISGDQATPIVRDIFERLGNEDRLNDCDAASQIDLCSHQNDAGVLCLESTRVPECNETDVRLVGGTSDREGRVQVCQLGEWGSVCDNADFWDNDDAAVICRQLGLGSNGITASFGTGDLSTPVAASELECFGDENLLLACKHNLFPTDCQHFNDVGVECLTELGCGNGDIRLTGGDSQTSSGQVELCNNGEWGVVCDDFWDARDATVVCRQFGYARGEAVRNSTFDSGTTMPIFLDDLMCNGAEASLLECPNRIGVHDCANTEHAGVRCTNTAPPCVENDVRLENGTSVNDGRVEICVFGQWEAICRNYFWTNQAATLVCRQLGLSSDGVVGSFGTKEKPFIDFQCAGHEASLSDCRIRQQLSSICSGGSAGVSCIDRQAADCSEGEIRIFSDGISEQFGRVEVCLDSVWGTVCDYGWRDTDAGVVCRQLGYIGCFATTQSAFRLPTLRPTFLDDVACDGTESNLLDCGHRNTFAIDYPSCYSNEYAGVVCDGVVERCLELDDIDILLPPSEPFQPNTFGTCELYAGTSELCSGVYEASTFVYILSARGLTQTQLATQLDSIITSSVFEDEQCMEQIMRILCHYYFPQCGSNNITYLPIAICHEECIQVQDTCSRYWDVVQDILAENDIENIDCLSTEAAGAPLPSCCIGAGIRPFSTDSYVGVVYSCADFEIDIFVTSSGDAIFVINLPAPIPVPVGLYFIYHEATSGATEERVSNMNFTGRLLVYGETNLPEFDRFQVEVGFVVGDVRGSPFNNAAAIYDRIPVPTSMQSHSQVLYFIAAGVPTLLLGSMLLICTCFWFRIRNKRKRQYQVLEIRGHHYPDIELPRLPILESATSCIYDLGIRGHHYPDIELPASESPRIYEPLPGQVPGLETEIGKSAQQENRSKPYEQIQHIYEPLRTCHQYEPYEHIYERLRYQIEPYEYIQCYEQLCCQYELYMNKSSPMKDYATSLSHMNKSNLMEDYTLPV